MNIKWKKCSFLKRKINFLGHIIEDGTIKPSTEKTAAVQKFQELNSIKKVQHFLGLTGYFRKFIRGYSVMAKPLTNLLKKDVVFKYGQEERLAVNSLKEALITQPVLHIFRQGAETELHTDASQKGFGAILFQKSDENKWNPVHYMSKTTSEADQKRHSYFLEVKAVFLALLKFRCYLLGMQFKLFTDCNALVSTLKKNELPAAVARWIMYFQEYTFTKQERMRHVDALSRCYAIQSVETELLARIRKAQAENSYIKAVKEVLKTKEYDDNIFTNNILFKFQDVKNLVVVPKTMEKQII